MAFKKEAIIAPFSLYAVPLSISVGIAMIAGYSIFSFFKKRQAEQRLSTPQIEILDESPQSPEAIQAHLGFYLENLWSIDTQNNEFIAKVWLWSRWKHQSDPIKLSDSESHVLKPNLQVDNAVESDFTPQYWDKDFKISPGERYDGMVLRGKFHTEFELSNYPFDTQEITIQFSEAFWETDKVIFKPMPIEVHGINPQIRLGSWVLRKITLETGAVDFKTNWGGRSAAPVNTYARGKIRILLERIAFPYVLKTIIPLFIMAIISGMVFYIYPDELEVRSAISVTSILSIIALHITAGSGLPSIGYSTIMDKYFIICYLLSLIACVETIINARLLRINEKLAITLDRYAGISYAGFLILLFLTTIFH